MKHWPTMLLGLIVAVIFIIAIFSFQVRSTEKAVITTFGKITDVKGAGLHARWPYPIQSLHKFDIRLRCFDGNVGKIEETFTKDGKNVIVSIYVIYSINDCEKFFKNVVTVAEAEERLNSIMRTMKDGIIGKYNFDQLVNTDPKKMRLNEIENEIKQGIASLAEQQYGLYIKAVGIKSLGIPETISEKVFTRMKDERNVEAQKYRSEGETEAAKIKNEANKNQAIKIANAEAKAKEIRAEGDAKAAEYYKVFKKDPKLAAFLRKLDSLKKIMGTKTTLILDTNSVPFDLLKLNAEEFNEKQK